MISSDSWDSSRDYNNAYNMTIMLSGFLLSFSLHPAVSLEYHSSRVYNLFCHGSEYLKVSIRSNSTKNSKFIFSYLNISLDIFSFVGRMRLIYQLPGTLWTLACPRQCTLWQWEYPQTSCSSSMKVTCNLCETSWHIRLITMKSGIHLCQEWNVTPKMCCLDILYSPCHQFKMWTWPTFFMTKYLQWQLLSHQHYIWTL